MPSGSRKSKTGGSNDHHAYMGEHERSAIERWNRTVSQKSARSKGEEQDPNVQAYLQAKMDLFRTASSTGKQDARSVSSTRS